MPTLETVQALLVLFAWPTSVAMPLIYASRPWWKSDIGRALMLYSTGMALLVTVTALRLLAHFPDLGAPFLGSPPGLNLLRIVVYIYIIAGMLYMLTVIVRYRKGDHRESGPRTRTAR